jgi:hypothetical protein
MTDIEDLKESIAPVGCGQLEVLVDEQWVFVRGIWSKEGERVWKSGEFKAFSPCFIVNKTATPPYTIHCSVTARTRTWVD